MEFEPVGMLRKKLCISFAWTEDRKTRRKENMKKGGKENGGRERKKGERNFDYIIDIQE